jgi:predicted acetyltransferase
MLPVRDENLASVRVIAKNGGVIERSGVELDGGEVVSLYWITL